MHAQPGVVRGAHAAPVNAAHAASVGCASTVPHVISAVSGASLINRASAAPTSSLLVDRRVEHLEENMKRLKDQLESLVASASEDKRATELDASVGSWMHAKASHPTTEYVTLDDDIAFVVANVSPTAVSEGTVMSVSYPMHKVCVDEVVMIVMRRRLIDAETAEISGSWVVVNIPSADPSTLVSNFAF